jgi:hypothetical protein
MATLNQRRALIVGTQDEGPFSVIESQVPLSEIKMILAPLSSALVLTNCGLSNILFFLCGLFH